MNNQYVSFLVYAISGDGYFEALYTQAGKRLNYRPIITNALKSDIKL